MPNYADYQPVTSLPPASAEYRGRTVLLTAGGQNDVAYCCRRNSSGGHEWYVIMDTAAFQSGGAGAPSTADYLVGSAQAGLSAEIVVGATPGGDLGGTWAAPTVDATHSGSTHAATQAAAEATAAAALTTHEGTPHGGASAAVHHLDFSNEEVALVG